MDIVEKRMYHLGGGLPKTSIYASGRVVITLPEAARHYPIFCLTLPGMTQFPAKCCWTMLHLAAGR